MGIPRNLRPVLTLWAVAALSTGCDQVTKWGARTYLSGSGPLELLNHHLTLSQVENTGAFLSAGESLPPALRFSLLIAFPLITILAVAFFVGKSKPGQLVISIAAGLLVGGGLGNLYDRILHGSVTDFLFVQWGWFHTGIFNAADLCITAGTLLLVARAVQKKYFT